MPENPPEEENDPITSTSGSSSTSTCVQAGQTTAQWLASHRDDMDGMTIGERITTDWKDASNVAHSKATGREEGESDDDFKDRHIAAVGEAMLTDPPSP